MSRCSSEESLKWEPESSMLSLNNLSLLCYKSEQNLSAPLPNYKRSHSVGYLPTYEWNVQEVPIDIESDVTPPMEVTKLSPQSKKAHPVLQLPQEKTSPPPEKFYHIVPVTPHHNLPFNQQCTSEKQSKQFAFKKQTKFKQLANFRRSTPKSKLKKGGHKKSNQSLQQVHVKNSGKASKKSLFDKVENTSLAVPSTVQLKKR